MTINIMAIALPKFANTETKEYIIDTNTILINTDRAINKAGFLTETLRINISPLLTISDCKISIVNIVRPLPK